MCKITSRGITKIIFFMYFLLRIIHLCRMELVKTNGEEEKKRKKRRKFHRDFKVIEGWFERWKNSTFVTFACLSNQLHSFVLYLIITIITDSNVSLGNIHADGSIFICCMWTFQLEDNQREMKDVFAIWIKVSTSLRMHLLRVSRYWTWSKT